MSSLPAMWLRSGSGWEILTMPDHAELKSGFSTFSAIDSGFGHVVVGRAVRNGQIQGVAYNYVSGETHWAGTVAEGSDMQITGSRFTGTNLNGSVLAGTALDANWNFLPILSRWGETIELVSIPEETSGGWLYDIDNSAQHGAGFLIVSAPENQIQYIPARWTPEEGLVRLPDAFGTDQVSLIMISRNGRYIMARSRDASGVHVPTLWDRDQGHLQIWMPFPDDATWLAGDLTTITSDGGLKFGAGLREGIDGAQNEWHALIWHEDNRVEYARDYIAREFGFTLAQGYFRSVSRDERSLNLYGSVQQPDGQISPFVLRARSEADGFELLGYPPGGRAYAEARAVSDDGRTIVGVAAGMNGEVPAQWTPESGWARYPFLPESKFTPFFCQLMPLLRMDAPASAALREPTALPWRSILPMAR